jgi:hypothetical protein
MRHRLPATHHENSPDLISENGSDHLQSRRRHGASGSGVRVGAHGVFHAQFEFFEASRLQRFIGRQPLMSYEDRQAFFQRPMFLSQIL